ncbi:hypothetical protein O6V14_11065 [Sphingomonas faeni]
MPIEYGQIQFACQARFGERDSAIEHHAVGARMAGRSGMKSYQTPPQALSRKIRWKQ